MSVSKLKDEAKYQFCHINDDQLTQFFRNYTLFLS